MQQPAEVGRTLHAGRYRPDLDGIRAIAVTAVLIFHAYPSKLRGGFIGVDMFFVLSGYLITALLIRDFDEQRFSILRFYERRIRRIFPALLAIFTASVLVGWYVLFRSEFADLGRQLLACSLFSENLLLWRQSGYFDTASSYKPMLHLWSLAVEEQFYLAWPVLLYLASKTRQSRGTLILILGLGSFALNLYQSFHDPAAAYYSPLGRSWELMLGAGLAHLHATRNSSATFSANRVLPSLLGLALCLAGFVFIREGRIFPGFWALLPTCGTALLIAASEHSWLNRVLLASRPFVGCGLISYPLYLWHWTLLSYANIIFGTIPPIAVRALCLAAALLAATLTFLFIERPFRSFKPGYGVPQLAGAMLLFLAFGALVTTRLVPARLQRISVPESNEWAFIETLPQTQIAKERGIFNIQPQKPRQVLWLGDSHVAQYAARIAHVAGQQNAPAGAVLALGAGCIPIEHVFVQGVEWTGCWPFRDQALQLAGDNRFQTIVLGGAWNWYFLNSAYEFQSGQQSLPLESPSGRAAALAQISLQLSTWRSQGRRVYLLLDDPYSTELPRIDPAYRISLHVLALSQNAPVRIPAEQLELRNQMIDLAHKAGVGILDPTAAVCQGDLCRKMDEQGTMLYRDVGHFNPAWVAGHATFIDPPMQ